MKQSGKYLSGVLFISSIAFCNRAEKSHTGEANEAVEEYFDTSTILFWGSVILVICYPGIEKGKFFDFKARRFLKFWANLSTKYDIKKVSKSGVKILRIIFFGVFPLLNGNKLQTGKDKFAGELRADLFEVKPRSGTDEFVTVKLPRRSS
jgi:hypothetical protein